MQADPVQSDPVQSDPVRIVLDVSQPGDHLVRVTQTLPATDAPRRTLRMPAWVPGSYKIYDFARNVQDFEAEVAGRKARWRQDAKDAWTVHATAGKAVTVRFNVYGRDLSVEGTHVTNDHAHLYPPTLVLYDDASRGQPHRVEVKRPKAWRLWSGLERKELDGTLADAADYDHLLDCPIEVGPEADYHVDAFSVRGRKHRIVLWQTPGAMDGARIRKDIKAVVEATARLWGGLPYDHYTFLGHVALDHGGGLEHRNSTVLGIQPLHLVADEHIKTKFLPLVAHEFFHTWNVKRMLPAAFIPYDLQREVYTDLLWLFEGFTTYYELPLLARADVVDDEAWGKLAAEMLKYYEMALGRKRLSVAEASRLTWTLLYQPHEHNINRNISYYTKGLWVGLCLDAHLRSNGVKDGLDTVMRHLWKRFGTTGEGVPEDAFASLVQQATGVDCGRLLANWIDGTTELPIVAAFGTLGFDVKHELGDEKKPLGLGVQFKEGTSRIERIPEDSPAHHVLQPDDELVAVDDYRWKADAFAEWVAGRDEGDDVHVTVFREGRLRTFPVPLRSLAKDKITITARKGDAAATRRRKAWLDR